MWKWNVFDVECHHVTSRRKHRNSLKELGAVGSDDFLLTTTTTRLWWGITEPGFSRPQYHQPTTAELVIQQQQWHFLWFNKNDLKTNFGLWSNSSSECWWETPRTTYHYLLKYFHPPPGVFDNSIITTLKSELFISSSITSEESVCGDEVTTVDRTVTRPKTLSRL